MLPFPFKLKVQCIAYGTVPLHFVYFYVERLKLVSLNSFLAEPRSGESFLGKYLVMGCEVVATTLVGNAQRMHNSF